MDVVAMTSSAPDRARAPTRTDAPGGTFGRALADTPPLGRHAGAAHSVAFEQADEVQRLLTETIVPATYRN